MPAFEMILSLGRRIFAGIGVSLVLLAAAGPALGQKVVDPTFRLSSRVEAVEGMGVRQRAFVACGTNEFCVLLPRGYNGTLEGAQSLVLSGPDNLTFVSIARVAVDSVAGKELDTGKCLAALMADYPGATILAEMTLGAGNRVGPAFDLVWVAPTKMVCRIRVAYVPGPVGVLRFTLSTTAERFPSVRFDLNSVMSTLVAGPKGGLEVPRLSNLF
jgi:hypothetical protein